MNKLSGIPPDLDLDDPRFRVRPYQQIVASCTGAFITSIFGKIYSYLIQHNFYKKEINSIEKILQTFFYSYSFGCS